jgi:hypothetical protein
MRLLLPVMEVFISWSGGPAKTVANELREWLPVVHQAVQPWFSEQDIAAGSVWRDEVREALKRAAFCIVCVTKGSAVSPWVNYEVGAIHEGFQKPVCPYVIGDDVSSLVGLPLSHLQAVAATLEGTLKMMRSLNVKAQQPLQEKLLERAVKANWKDLAKVLSRHVELLESSAEPDAAIPQQSERAPISDDDACNMIIAMLHGLTAVEERGVFNYADIDRKLGFVGGTASRVFKKAAKEVGYALRNPTERTTLIQMPAFSGVVDLDSDQEWGRRRGF